MSFKMVKIPDMHGDTMRMREGRLQKIHRAAFIWHAHMREHGKEHGVGKKIRDGTGCAQGQEAELLRQAMRLGLISDRWLERWPT